MDETCDHDSFWYWRIVVTIFRRSVPSRCRIQLTSHLFLDELCRRKKSFTRLSWDLVPLPFPWIVSFLLPQGEEDNFRNGLDSRRDLVLCAVRSSRGLCDGLLFKRLFHVQVSLLFFRLSEIREPLLLDFIIRSFYLVELCEPFLDGCSFWLKEKLKLSRSVKDQGFFLFSLNLDLRRNWARLEGSEMES